MLDDRSQQSLMPLLMAALLACTTAAAQPEEEQTPLEVGLEEQIEVQLVLVDFLVLDRKDRTVPDLTAVEWPPALGDDVPKICLGGGRDEDR